MQRQRSVSNGKTKNKPLSFAFLRLHRTCPLHVVVVVVLQRTAKKCTKIYNARAQPLFCSLSLLLGDVLVAVVFVVCLIKLPTDSKRRQWLLQILRFFNHLLHCVKKNCREELERPLAAKWKRSTILHTQGNCFGWEIMRCNILSLWISFLTNQNRVAGKKLGTSYLSMKLRNNQNMLLGKKLGTLHQSKLWLWCSNYREFPQNLRKPSELFESFSVFRQFIAASSYQPLLW